MSEPLGFPLRHSSGLLCFFKCICHLEDVETLNLMLLLDSFNVHTVEELEQSLKVSKSALAHCFTSIGLEEASVAHITSCIEALSRCGHLSMPLKVTTGRSNPLSPVGLDCIDTPTSSATSPIPPQECSSLHAGLLAGCHKKEGSTLGDEHCPERTRWQRGKKHVSPFDADRSPATHSISRACASITKTTGSERFLEGGFGDVSGSEKDDVSPIGFQHEYKMHQEPEEPALGAANQPHHKVAFSLDHIQDHNRSHSHSHYRSEREHGLGQGLEQGYKQGHGNKKHQESEEPALDAASQPHHRVAFSLDHVQDHNRSHSSEREHVHGQGHEQGQGQTHEQEQGQEHGHGHAHAHTRTHKREPELEPEQRYLMSQSVPNFSQCSSSLAPAHCGMKRIPSTFALQSLMNSLDDNSQRMARSAPASSSNPLLFNFFDLVDSDRKTEALDSSCLGAMASNKMCPALHMAPLGLQTHSEASLDLDRGHAGRRAELGLPVFSRVGSRAGSSSSTPKSYSSKEEVAENEGGGDLTAEVGSQAEEKVIVTPRPVTKSLSVCIIC